LAIAEGTAQGAIAIWQFKVLLSERLILRGFSQMDRID
jgi:hypothetical protein